MLETARTVDETAFVRVGRSDPALLVLGNALCTTAPHACWRIDEGKAVGATATAVDVATVGRTFELEGQPCRLGLDRKLVCRDGKLDAREVELLRGDVLFGKRDGADLVATFGAYDAPDRLRPITSLPPKLRQVSIAVRVGCALTASREVWCWSDPKRPRKREVPRDVEDIAVIDPFGLCVRTAAGEVSCTPPVAAAGHVLCNSEGLECRHRAELGGPKGKPFDPLTPLLQPLVAQPLGFAARRFVRDEYQVFPIVPDLVEDMFSDPDVGGCAIGPVGEVACVLGCALEGRGVYRVTGMPAIVDLRTDATTGYGVAATGELWVWPRVPARCTEEWSSESKPRLPLRGEVAAQRAALPPIAHLAPLLHYEGRRKFGTDVRCATLRDTSVRCWEPTDAGGLGTVFDPAAAATP